MSVRLRRRLRLLRDERGTTLMELLTSMTILMTMMASLTGLLVSGTNAEVDMNKRFQAQTEARLGFDRLRREIHCSSNATPAGASSSVTLSTATCPNAGGSNVTWCTVANGSGRYGLWRYAGVACSGTGIKVADFLTTQNAFNYLAPVSGSLRMLGVTLAVNLTPSKPERVYTLTDEIVLRNSTRTP